MMSFAAAISWAACALVIRDREKVTRNLKKDDSPILSGMQLFHNHVRPHMGLNGKTPADLAGIQVEGEDEWLTLIQNASKVRNISSHAVKHDWHETGLFTNYRD
jgi:hypothetical protein